MPLFRKSSIQRKLVFVVLCTGIFGLSLACAAFQFYEWSSFRASMTDELSTLANTLGSNALASLTFEDPDSARDVLASLVSDPHITAACLYDKRGNVFAEYRRKGLEANCSFSSIQEDGAVFAPSSLTLFRSLFQGGEKAGTIAIICDLSELHAKMREYTEISALVLLVSVLASFLISSRLLSLLTEPILQLTQIAERVSDDEDYTLRALPGGDRDVNTLVSSFNHMLERVQERDLALQGAKEDLEVRVHARTEELQQEVNERTLAEVKLQSSLKELEDLKCALDQHCIVARTDPRGVITFVNDKFCSASKYNREELLGQTHRIVKSGHHSKEFYQDLWSTIKSGRTWQGEVKNRAKDGTFYWTDTTIVPFCDASGKPTQFIAIRMDITELKRIEEELRRAKDVAEQANRAKSEFLANMSHEIRTPLNGVMGMTDLVLDTDLSIEQREHLETVKMSADSLLTVINDILDFSKIEAGRVDLELMDFNLRDCVEAALKTLAVRADEKGLELLCDVDPEVPQYVRGDSSRLRQILINLVGNAIKFTQNGEVALTVCSLAVKSGHRILQFTVADTGIGIPPEKLSSIFDPFTQGDTSTTRKYGGTGLGLTISARLVAMMGGRIWVDSEPGKGSQFHFTARMPAATALPIDMESSILPVTLRGVRVLVVDDNPTNRRILDGLLQQWGMRPALAESGQDALTQLSAARSAEDRFRLILTDMHMPQMDGFQLVESIRKSADSYSPTIMMLTSAGFRGDAERCQELGVAAYLLKPVRQSELREAICRVLAQHQVKTPKPLITRHSLGFAGRHGSSLRVLVAEDNPVNQRLIARLLEKRGHRVTLADNGRTAFEALKQGEFDLVFMDVQMPEMDGFETTLAIREREKSTGSHLPVIALTAHAMKGDKEKCLLSGMDGYLSKPIRPQELDDLLDQYNVLAPATSSSPQPAEQLT